MVVLAAYGPLAGSETALGSAGPAADIRAGHAAEHIAVPGFRRGRSRNIDAHLRYTADRRGFPDALQTFNGLISTSTAPGELDPTFSDDGKQTADFPGGELAFDVAVQADGKIVAVGDADGAFGVARYNADGTLDTGSSDDGMQTIAFADDAEANAVVIQPDGKIVVVGFTAYYDGDALGPADIALARFNADGTLDTSFSDDRRQITDFGGNEYCLCFDVALQPDGKIVVAGIGDWDFALARYNADGTLDTSFSGDGKQTTGFGSDARAAGVVLRSTVRSWRRGPATSFKHPRPPPPSRWPATTPTARSMRPSPATAYRRRTSARAT
jgi:uncharacterized delta-60 repeat protein